MKRLFRNNYIDVQLVKGIVVGIAMDESKDWVVLLGPLVITIHSYMFKKPRRTKVGKDIVVF
jgi:hypothetical protein